MTDEHERELQRILCVYTSRMADEFDYELAEENLYALIGNIERMVANAGMARDS